jgi:multiple sugar transport system substrate-binding protein
MGGHTHDKRVVGAIIGGLGHKGERRRLSRGGRGRRQRVNRFLIAAASMVVLGMVYGTAIGSASEALTAPLPLAGKKVTCVTDREHLPSFAALGEWFHEATGAVVENVAMPSDDMLRVSAEDVSGTCPRFDVLLIRYQYLGTLVEQGVLAHLTAFIEENTAILAPQDYIPGLYDAFTLYKGMRWALPYDCKTGALFFRTSLLDKYHLKPPRTWGEYSDVANTVTVNEKANGIYGTAIMLGGASVTIVSTFMERLIAQGGGLLDHNGRPSLYSPEAVVALTGLVEQAKAAVPTPVETDRNASQDAFLGGKVAMVEQWTDLGFMAEDPSLSVIRGDWDVVAMPTGNGSVACSGAALNGGFSLSISARAPNMEVARAFVLFASRPDTALQLNLIRKGVDPTRTSVLESQEYKLQAPKLTEVMRDSLQNAVAWPTIPQMPQLLEILSSNLQCAIEGRKSPEQAMKDAQHSWLEVLGRH